MSRTLGVEGAFVVVHDKSESSRELASETVEAVKTAGGNAFAFQANLTKVPEVVTPPAKRAITHRY